MKMKCFIFPFDFNEKRNKLMAWNREREKRSGEDVVLGLLDYGRRPLHPREQTDLLPLEEKMWHAFNRLEGIELINLRKWWYLAPCFPAPLGHVSRLRGLWVIESRKQTCWPPVGSSERLHSSGLVRMIGPLPLTENYYTGLKGTLYSF